MAGLHHTQCLHSLLDFATGYFQALILSQCFMKAVDIALALALSRICLPSVVLVYTSRAAPAYLFHMAANNLQAQHRLARAGGGDYVQMVVVEMQIKFAQNAPLVVSPGPDKLNTRRKILHGWLPHNTALSTPIIPPRRPAGKPLPTTASIPPEKANRSGPRLAVHGVHRQPLPPDARSIAVASIIGSNAALGGCRRQMTA